jgi:DNA-binding transcriptional LysR family regulator
MKIYQFKIFDTVTKAKSFSKAASLLYLSQPAVSKHIKSMEEYYGIKLFERTNQGVTLTSAGQTVYDYCKKILNVHDELESEIDKHLDIKNLNLTIGASVTPGEYLLPCTVWTFKDKHPQINIKLKINDTNKIVEKVLKDEVDIGIVEGNIPPKSNLKTEKIMYDKLKFIAPPDKYKKDTFTLDELKEMPLVLLHEDFGIRQKFNQFLAENNLKSEDLNIITEMGSITSIKSAVEAGLGISVVSHSSIKREAYQGTIKKINIKNKFEDKLKIKIKLAHQDRKDPPKIITRFIKFLKIQNEYVFC